MEVWPGIMSTVVCPSCRGTDNVSTAALLTASGFSEGHSKGTFLTRRYEGASCAHGRPRPLVGNWMVRCVTAPQALKLQELDVSSCQIQTSTRACVLHVLCDNAGSLHMWSG